MVIDVAARHHVDGGARAAHDQHVIDDAGADALDGGVHVHLERNLAAAAQALVGGDDEGGLGVLDAARQRIRREAAEHDRVDRPEPRAGEHGIGRFRDHRHVDRDPVALLDAAVAHDVGHAADLVVKLTVGDRLRLGRVVAFPDDRDLVAAGVEMPVDAVIGDVGDAVLEPADRDVAGAEIGVLDPGRGGEPVDALGFLGPEGVRVPDGSLVLRAIAGIVQIGAVAPLGRNVVDLLFHGASPRRILE